MSKKTLRLYPSEIPEPDIRPSFRTGLWTLRTDYLYVDDLTAIVIPAGFTCDGASIPKAIHSLIGSFDLSITAPLIHDYLYRYQGLLPVDYVTPYRIYDRIDADNLFSRVMEEEGVPVWRRKLAYGAVRALGRWAWNKRKEVR